MLQDVRQALRVMKKSPVLTVIILLTLAVGIGANVAIVTAVNAVLLRPLAVTAPERLVLVWEALPKLGQKRLPVTAAEFVNYANSAHSFELVAGFTTEAVTLTGYRDPERVKGARVSARLFPMLGVSPAIGRTISVDEDRPNAQRSVVLSDALWRRKYAGDPTIVGKTIDINRQPHSVVGIMPASFTFPFEGTPFAKPAELWTPLALTADELRSTSASFGINVIARLKDHVSISQASSDVSVTAAAFRRDHPELYTGNLEVTASAEDLKDVLTAPVRPLLLLLLGAVAAVLLIACANVANLLLAQALVRSQEMAIRGALGADRTRLVRQLLTESLLLASVGGAAGLAVGFGAIKAIRLVGPPQIDWPRQLEPDGRVLLFTLAAALLTGIVFGVVPAIRLSRPDIKESLRDGAMRTIAGPARHRLRRLLTVVQIASSAVLLIGAGLLINSFLRVLKVPPGFDADGVLVGHTVFDPTRYASHPARVETEKRILERLSAIAGVRAAAAASVLPLANETRIGVRVDAEDFAQIHIVSHNLVSPDYFKAMGIPLLAGRSITDRDTPDAPSVVIVSASLARQYWPEQAAIGKRLQWGRSRPPFTVIGVVPDVRVSGLDAESLPMVYMSMFQVTDTLSPELALVVSTSGAPGPYSSALRTEVLSVDKDLPVFGVGSMSEVISASLAQRRFSMILVSAFSVISLLLAASGLYAVVSYFVTERTRELGVRLALGARRVDVLALVFRQAAGLVAIGLAVGVAASVGLARFMHDMVYGISPLDPTTFVGVSLFFVLVAMAASLIPAMRAAAADPLRALKAE
jgi:predicted permease